MIHESNHFFLLNTANTSYAFRVMETGHLEHLYYGKTIGHDDLRYTRGTFGGSAVVKLSRSDVKTAVKSYNHFGSELTFHGTGDYREPMVEVVNPAGDRLTQLLYDSHEILSGKPAIKGI